MKKLCLLCLLCLSTSFNTAFASMSSCAAQAGLCVQAFAPSGKYDGKIGGDLYTQGEADLHSAKCKLKLLSCHSKN